MWGTGEKKRSVTENNVFEISVLLGFLNSFEFFDARELWEHYNQMAAIKILKNLALRI